MRSEIFKRNELISVSDPHDEECSKRPAQKAGELPLRSEVDPAICWSVDEMFESDEDFEKTFAEVEKAAEEFPKKYQGKLAQSADVMYEALSELDKCTRKFSNLYSYSSMKHDEDTANSKYLAYDARCGALAAKLMAKISFVSPEISAMPQEKVDEFLKDDRLKIYEHAADDIMRRKPHILDEKTEAILAKASDCMGGGDIFSVLNDADLEFPKVKDEEGNEIQLSHGRFSTFLNSKDRRVRKDAFKGMYKPYRQYRNTFATTLSKAVKANNFNAEVHNFKSAREAALFDNNIPESVFDGLLEGIHDNLPLLHRYVSLRKRLLGLDEVYPYDLYVPVVEDVECRYSIEEAKEIVIEATAPLGEDYQAIMKKAFAENWVDFAENKGKRSGAYSGGTYDSKPYILITWKNTIDNLFTLIHELGHSCHSYLTRENQESIYGGYSIFLAEIASTTNENLLTRYLLKNESDSEMKKNIVMNYLDGFKATVFRQTQFAEFEHMMHEEERKGTALTAEFLSEKYGELNQRYYGPDLAVDEDISLEWSRIPHFYYNYYVYQYATGFSAATAFAASIEEGGKEAAEKYKGFLKAGSSAYPIDVLKNAGLDMTSPKPVNNALKTFESYLDMMDELTK